jgi:hypothetical protein
VPVCENRPVPTATRSHLVVLLLTSALVLGACSDDGGDDDDTGSASTSATTEAPDSETTAPSTEPATTAPATTTPPETTPETTPACPPLEGGTVGATESIAGEGTANLTGVEITSGDCTDVVAFTFESTAPGAPGYQISYQPGPFTQDGSGAPVPVAGGAFLVVRFEPAYTFDFEAAIDTYTGPDRVTSPGALFTAEVVKTGDFEAVVTWVIGLDQQRPYTVTSDTADPHRVHIEIR